MADNSVSLRRNGRFQLLLNASLVSMVGSRLTSIAYPMIVLYLTRSPVMAGIAVFAATMPSIFVYLPAGALVDRWNPRRTMVVSESLRGLAIGVVVFLLLSHHPFVWLIIVMAVAEEILEVFSMLAERRVVRVLVRPEQVSKAQVSIEARTHVVVLVGRAFGSLLFEAGHVFPFLADALSFVCSIASILGIGRNPKFKADTLEQDRVLGSAVRKGLAWVKKDPFARGAISVSGGVTFISQALIIVFLSEASARRISSTDIGIVLAAPGLGGIIGAVTAPRLKIFASRSRVKFQPLAWLIVLVILWLTRGSIPGMAITMLTFGLVGSLGNVELETYLVREVPQGMLARVTSVEMLLSFGACALGPLLGGCLVEKFGVITSVGVLCFLAFGCLLLAFRMPPLPNHSSVPERPSADVPATAPQPEPTSQPVNA